MGHFYRYDIFRLLPAIYDFQNSFPYAQMLREARVKIIAPNIGIYE